MCTTRDLSQCCRSSARRPLALRFPRGGHKVPQPLQTNRNTHLKGTGMRKTGLRAMSRTRGGGEAAARGRQGCRGWRTGVCNVLTPQSRSPCRGSGKWPRRVVADPATHTLYTDNQNNTRSPLSTAAPAIPGDFSIKTSMGSPPRAAPRTAALGPATAPLLRPPHEPTAWGSHVPSTSVAFICLAGLAAAPAVAVSTSHAPLKVTT
jgi:hypothetical protein